MLKTIYLEQDGFRIEVTVQSKSVATYSELQHLTPVQEERFISSIKQALSDLMTDLADNEVNRKNLTLQIKENKNEEDSIRMSLADDDVPF